MWGPQDLPVWLQGRFLSFLRQSAVHLARHFRGVYELSSRLYRWRNWASVRLFLKKCICDFFGVQIITTRTYFFLLFCFIQNNSIVLIQDIEVSEAIFSKWEELLFIGKLHALGNLEFSASSPLRTADSTLPWQQEDSARRWCFLGFQRQRLPEALAFSTNAPYPVWNAPAARNGNGEERNVAGKSAIALSPPFGSSDHALHSRRIWTTKAERKFIVWKECWLRGEPRYWPLRERTQTVAPLASSVTCFGKTRNRALFQARCALPESIAARLACSRFWALSGTQVPSPKGRPHRPPQAPPTLAGVRPRGAVAIQPKRRGLWGRSAVTRAPQSGRPQQQQ